MRVEQQTMGNIDFRRHHGSCHSHWTRRKAACPKVDCCGYFISFFWLDRYCHLQSSSEGMWWFLWDWHANASILLCLPCNDSKKGQCTLYSISLSRYQDDRSACFNAFSRHFTYLLLAPLFFLFLNKCLLEGERGYIYSLLLPQCVGMTGPRHPLWLCIAGASLFRTCAFLLPSF